MPRNRVGFIAFLVGWAIFMLYTLVLFVRHGDVIMAVAAVWFTSSALLSWIAWHVEHRPLGELFDLQKVSWAFTFGDTITLPMTAVACALAWRHMQTTGTFWTSDTWSIGCVGIGVLAGIIFRLCEVRLYRKRGAALGLQSPTKLAHDVGFPVLFGGLGCVGLPVLWEMPLSWYSFFALLGVVLWALGLLRDAVKRLDLRDLHPAWDSKRWVMIPWSEIPRE